MQAYVLMNRPDNEGDVAELIQIHSACAEYHVLPKAGGVLDQPARLMYLLNETRQAFAQRELREQERAKAEAEAKGRRR